MNRTLSTPTKGGFLRLEQIIGRPEVTQEEANANRVAGKYPVRKRPACDGLIPVSSSTWWRWVSIGRAPKPVKLGPGVTAWRKSDVLDMLEQAAA
jgi:predicted DNA-binding transcriptional regulator AlpA